VEDIRQMEFEQVVKNRRSIRKYITDKEVSEEDLNKILESARLCQSAKNRQPWLFKVITKEEKDKVVRLMLDWHLENKKTIRKDNSCRYTAECIIDAPVLINVFKIKDDYYNLSDNVSIGAAIEHMCLEATNLGLGSLWIRDTYCIANELISMVNRPDLDLELISSIIIGYPDEHPKQRPRKNLKDILL